MQIINNIIELQALLDARRTNGSVGFVPTMGALHEGHLSLVRQSVSNNYTTVVSIYVNPTQFNDSNDLERYPRTLDNDAALLESTGCDFIFAPTDSEMYPTKDTRKFDFGALESVMEGEHRPGHFNGVGQIVSKLFDAVQPDKAYFGLKDFQQLAVIKKLVRDYNFSKIEIVPCAIVRESDGLAMSSRNTLLEPKMRELAPFIYKTLKDLKANADNMNIKELKDFVVSAFDSQENLQLEYFEIVDDISLQPIANLLPEIPVTACIAVHAGNVRLIDNIQINS